MTAHNHTEVVSGCFRCELGRDELGAQPPLDLDAIQAKWANYPDMADVHALVAEVRRLREQNVKIAAIALELLAQPDWLANGHRASDYGHDVLVALGNPDLAAAALGGQ